MLMAYLDYPTARISIHRAPACTAIQQHRLAHQRRYPINRDTISAELRKIQARDRQYQFASDGKLDDMWLEVDFQDAAFEEAIVRYMQRLLGQRYTPFRDARVNVHECSGQPSAKKE
jgi:hypothetical protein